MSASLLSHFLPRKIVNEKGDFEIKMGQVTYFYLNHLTLKSGLRKEYYKCANNPCPARLQLLVDTQTVFLSTAHEDPTCLREMQKILAVVQPERRTKLDIILEETFEEEDSSDGELTFNCTFEVSDSTLLCEHLTMQASDVYNTDQDSTPSSDLTLLVSDDESTLPCDLTQLDSRMDSPPSSSSSEESYHAMNRSFVSRYARRK